MQIDKFLKTIESPTSFLFIKDLSRRAFPNNINPKNERNCNILRNRFSLEDKEKIEFEVMLRGLTERERSVFSAI